MDIAAITIATISGVAAAALCAAFGGEWILQMVSAFSIAAIVSFGATRKR